MFKNISTNFSGFGIIAGFFSILLISCDNESVDHSKYIPSNSCLVAGINTDQIFSDAMFELISNTDLTEGLINGPLAGLVEDPANAGLIRFDRYYFFAAGTNVLNARLGAVLPLDDAVKLKSYLEKNFEAKANKKDIYSVAEILPDHFVVWDEKTAIYVYGPAGGEVVKDAINYFSQEGDQVLASKDSTFDVALRDASHIVTWIKNDDLINGLDSGLKQIGFNLIKTIGIDQESLKDSKTILSINFKEGSLVIDSKRFLGKEQAEIYKDLNKPNAVAGLLNATGAEKPVAIATVSLKEAGLKKFFEKFKINELMKDKMGAVKLPIKNISSDLILSYFNGDGVLILNDFSKVTKNQSKVVMNEEGEDVQTVVQVTEKMPQFTAAFSLKNPAQIQLYLGLVGGMFQREGNVYSFNNQIYFTINGKNLYLGTSPKGGEIIKNLSKSLNPELTSLATGNTVSGYIDLQRFLSFGSELNPEASNSLNIASELLKDLTVSEVGINEENVVIGQLVINFSDKTHSLINTVKFLDKVAPSLIPMAAGMVQ